eukprot:8247195-Prorocentrum_lima.AAC.1
MTSSLVGSEMCIRDRSVCSLPSMACDLEGVQPVCSLPSMASISEGVHGAVSYTHLTLPTICSV